MSDKPAAFSSNKHICNNFLWFLSKQAPIEFPLSSDLGSVKQSAHIIHFE